MDSTSLLARIRQVGQISDNDEDWTSTEILAEATQATQTHFPKTLINTRSGFWMHRQTVPMVAGQKAYQIPVRAIVGGLENVEITTDNRTYYPLSILTEHQALDYGWTSSGIPRCFSLEADCVILYPAPSDATYSIRFTYYLRPSTLTAAVTGGVVLVKDANSVNVDAPVAGMSTVGPTYTIDCIHTTGSFELSLVSVSATYGAGAYTFPVGTDMSRISVGDVIRVAETSDQIQLPQELHRPLADYTAATILAAKGDMERAQVLVGKCENAITKFVDIATPRVKDSPFLMKTKNTFLRRRVRAGRW